MISRNHCVILNLFLVSLFVKIHCAVDVTKYNTINDNVATTKIESERTGRSLQKECGGGSLNSKCLKIHAISLLEDLGSREELSLLPGLSIVKEIGSENATKPEDLAAELSKQFPGRPEEKLNRFLLYRLQSYLDGHSIRYRLLDAETAKEAMEVVSSDKQTGRKGGGGGGFGGGGSKGGGGGGGALLAAGLMMKGTLAAAALGALALLAGKALMTALMSLLLSALVGLKGMHGGGGHTTYEIISKPVVSHHHSQSHEEHHEHAHGHGHHEGYRRAYDNNDNTNNYYA